MTRQEWLNIGYDKNIIDDFPADEAVSFLHVYKLWFKMKMHCVKPETLDRIEVTFNKYYAQSELVCAFVHTFDKLLVCNFLNSVIVDYHISRKEFERVYQIINNVLVYALDMNIGHCPLIDWGFVRRCVYSVDFDRSARDEYIISDNDRRKLFSSVVCDDIYPCKRSACLLLLMNFYLGLRIGELASLKFCDFDLDNRLLKIYKTEVKYYERDSEGLRSGSMIYNVVNDVKTPSSFRCVPLPDDCIRLYKLLCEHHQRMNYRSEYLCYDGSDTIMTRSLERTLSRLCKLNGIQHINSHRIRKTYASLLHMGGVPTRVITDLCGHSDMETTERCYLLNYEAGYSTYMNLINKSLKIK